VLALRPMQFVGGVSYSWYLWHWPLLLLLPAALDREPDLQTSLLAVAGSFGLAVASFYVVEEPFRRNAELVRHPQRAIMLGSGLVAASVAAAVALSLVVVVPGRNDGPALPTVALSPESVVLATKLTALPADITPALESAQRDEANTRNCFATWFDTVPKTGPDCVFGDPEGTRSMVLFGDSHAAQWMGPVGSWASASKVKMYFLAKPACPAGTYPDLIPAALQRVYRECNEYREKSFEFMKQLKPDLVVIGSLSKGAAVRAEGMTATVNTLRGAGAQVLYIADNPYMGIDPPSCLAQHPDNVQRCAVPRTAAGLDTTARLDEIRGAQEGGAQIWDPVPLMCADVCPSVIGNVVVYKDENHLTNTFTRSLLPELAPVLSTLIDG
jgi:hypothetical protein